MKKKYLVEISVGIYISSMVRHTIEDVCEAIVSDDLLSIIPSEVMTAMKPGLFDFSVSNKEENGINIDVYKIKKEY